MRIYIIYEGDSDPQLVGIYDKKGLKAYLKAHRKNSEYHTNYTINEDTGVRKYDGLYKIPKTYIRVSSYPLNKPNYGREIEWRTFK